MRSNLAWISQRLLVALCLMGAQPLLLAEDLDFTAGLDEFRELRNMLRAHVRRLGLEHLEKRREAVARWTASDVKARKAYVRERLQESLGGPFPERTPLNPRVTGTVDRGDYRIEKIVFESQPSFYVTANLYVPARGQPPFPAVLYPLGHEAGAKSHHAWQQMLGSLAKRGYVALAWDPVGQGERVQLWDPEAGGPKLASSTTEHSMLGIQCLLTGDNLARYTIWDGIRALDYLLSRKEVDPNRIAVTGNSGGGTHTAYLAALEDRIHVAAPSCYLTNWRLLLETRGPQDAEQNLPPWLAAGLDHADFVHAFAGKPYLILSAIRDFFAIAGARETFAEAKRAYSLIDAADKVAMAEADDGHGFSQPRRIAAYTWFDQWLKGKAGEAAEPEVHMATEDELFCTESGQVNVSLGGETVFKLNRRRADQFRKAQPGGDLAAHVRRLTGYQQPEGPVSVRSYGVLRRSGYSIEKLVYDSEPGIVVPALLFAPESGGPKKPAVLWIHARGKSIDAASDGDIVQLVRAGAVVLAIDARGYGETQLATQPERIDSVRMFGDFYSAMTALLVGKTLVGMRARDIIRGIDVLAARPEVDPQRIAAAGKEGAAVPLLHAAVLDPRIRKVALERMVLSYAAVLERPIHRQVFENVVRGVIRSYDLPTLAAALSRPVLIVDAVDSVGNLVKLERVRSEYGSAASAQIKRRGMNQSASSLFADLVQ
jgi:cephalosporin-C deacetylase-like acetyl esterase